MMYHVFKCLELDLLYMTYYAQQALSIEYFDSIDSNAKIVKNLCLSIIFSLKVDSFVLEYSDTNFP